MSAVSRSISHCRAAALARQICPAWSEPYCPPSVASHDSSTPGAPTSERLTRSGSTQRPNFMPEAVRVVAERRQAVRKARRIGGPAAEAGVEVERAGGAGARVPAGVDDEQLDAERGRAVHLRAHRRLVDLGAVREPGVVGDERHDRTPVAQAVEHVRAQRRRALREAARRDAEHHVRTVDRASARVVVIGAEADRDRQCRRRCG